MSLALISLTQLLLRELLFVDWVAEPFARTPETCCVGPFRLRMFPLWHYQGAFFPNQSCFLQVKDSRVKSFLNNASYFLFGGIFQDCDCISNVLTIDKIKNVDVSFTRWTHPYEPLLYWSNFCHCVPSLLLRRVFLYRQLRIWSTSWCKFNKFVTYHVFLM